MCVVLSLPMSGHDRKIFLLALHFMYLHSTRQVCQRRAPHLNQLYIAVSWSWLAFFMWIEDNLWVNATGRHDGKSTGLSFFWPRELSLHVNTVGEPTGCIFSTQYCKLKWCSNNVCKCSLPPSSLLLGVWHAQSYLHTSRWPVHSIHLFLIWLLYL